MTNDRELIKTIFMKLKLDELLEIYRDRVKDRKNFKSRRQKQLDTLPKKMDELLNQYFEKDNEALRRIEESRAILAWPQCVGRAASQVSEATRIRGRTLVVRVTDPLWMQQLMLLKQGLLKKYHQNFPKLGLNDIFFTRGL